MNVLFWTFGFLLFFASMTYLSLEQYRETLIASKLYLGKKAAERVAQRDVQVVLYELLVAEKSTAKVETESDKEEIVPREKKEKAELPVYLDFPPHNARLNLYKLFEEKNAKVVKSDFYEIFKTLIENVYGEDEDYKQIENASAAILDGILQRGTVKDEVGKIKLKKLEDLACISFDDPRLQKLYYKMLKGAKFREDSKGYASFFDFVTIEHRYKFEINIHHASKELLGALFRNPEIGEALYRKREALYNEGERFTKSKKLSRVSNLFLTKEEVSSILASFHEKLAPYEKFLDFKTGKPSQSALSRDFQITAIDPKTKLIAKKKIIGQ